MYPQLFQSNTESPHSLVDGTNAGCGIIHLAVNSSFYFILCGFFSKNEPSF